MSQWVSRGLVRVDFADPSVVDEQTIQFSAPSPATLEMEGPQEFRTLLDDTPGPVPITVTWLQNNVGGGEECSGGTSRTIQLQGPVPVQLSKIPKRLITRSHSFGWLTRIGPQADRRPLEVRVRGVGKAKLPAARVPFKVASIPLRPQDPGFEKARSFRMPRFLVTAQFTAPDRFTLQGAARVGSFGGKPLGYEIQVLQAGRQVARIRAAGACGALDCAMRIVKIER